MTTAFQSLNSVASTVADSVAAAAAAAAEVVVAAAVAGAFFDQDNSCLPSGSSASFRAVPSGILAEVVAVPACPLAASSVRVPSADVAWPFAASASSTASLAVPWLVPFAVAVVAFLGVPLSGSASSPYVAAVAVAVAACPSASSAAVPSSVVVVAVVAGPLVEQTDAVEVVPLPAGNHGSFVSVPFQNLELFRTVRTSGAAAAASVDVAAGVVATAELVFQPSAFEVVAFVVPSDAVSDAVAAYRELFQGSVAYQTDAETGHQLKFRSLYP